MKRIVIAASLLLAGCKANVGVSGVKLPEDSANTCAGLCSSIGLALDSVVVMANNVGCVCRAAPAAPPAPGASAASSAGGGMAAILIQQQAAQQQRQQSHRR